MFQGRRPSRIQLVREYERGCGRFSIGTSKSRHPTIRVVREGHRLLIEISGARSRTRGRGFSHVSAHEDVDGEGATLEEQPMRTDRTVERIRTSGDIGRHLASPGVRRRSNLFLMG